MGKKGIEQFSKAEFEAALPKHKETGAPLWTALGFSMGEYCYLIQPFPKLPYGIHVRSSVGEDGTAKDCGEDSIRGRVVSISPTGEIAFHGGKSQRWVTRQTGWQERMTDMLRKLANQVNYCRPCPKCAAVLVPYTSKKKGSTIKGQGFARCESDACRIGENKSATFFLTDDDDKEPIPPPDVLFPKTTTRTATVSLTACPNCLRASSIIGDRFSDKPEAVYCYPKRNNGCGWKGTKNELQAPEESDPPKPLPTKDNAATGPLGGKERNYEELRRFIVEALVYLDDSDSSKALGEVYHSNDTPIAALKQYLRNEKR